MTLTTVIVIEFHFFFPFFYFGMNKSSNKLFTARSNTKKKPLKGTNLIFFCSHRKRPSSTVEHIEMNKLKPIDFRSRNASETDKAAETTKLN